MAKNAKENQQLTAQEVCDLLGISIPTLHRRVRDQAINPLPKAVGLKRRHRLQFTRAEIERYLRENS